jgi:pilus assembly protein CpaE
MFRAVVLAPDAEFALAVERLALESGHLIVNKTIATFPESGYDVGRVIAGFDPEVILLENTQPDTALNVAEKLRNYAPNVAVVVLGGRVAPNVEQKFDEIGVACLNGAFSQRQFLAALKSAIHRSRQNSLGPVFAFLPGKAGSGATTVAYNMATSMAISLEKKVFLLEADLHSGVISTLLDRKPRLPLIDALQNAGQLDYSTWLKYVVTAHSTDFLLADRIKKTPLPSWMHYHQLLRFASSRYDAIFVDLPEVVNEATEEIVQSAQWTFVVCTPELASLTLAEQRLQELRAHNAPLDRLRVIVNRWHRSDMRPEEIAKLLGCQVTVAIKNDFRTISRAFASGEPVSDSTDIGRSYVEFGARLLGIKESAKRFSFF